MKNSLALKLEFDIKTIRKALVLLTGEMFTDEQIKQKFIDREHLVVDMEDALGEGDALQICSGFCALLVADEKVSELKKQEEDGHK